MVDRPYLQLTWIDGQTGASGHLVIDTLLRGVASGGLRMRPGCSLGEVTDLARVMTLKEALVYQPGERYLPFGGAKGGIDFDPRDPAAPGVLRRFLTAVRPYLECHWAAGEDLGTRQSDIDEAVAAVGLDSCVHAALPHVADGPETGLRRVADGFAVRADGLSLGDLVGGYGVAQAVLAALCEHGVAAGGQTAVVQGFGSMGGAAARYLTRAGMRVVGIVDAEGVVAHPDGLDVEALLAGRSPDGLVDRGTAGPGVRLLDRDAWLSVPADVLVTAATSYAIDDRNESDVRCRYLVEAANVSVRPSAETRLTDRGVIVVPDFLANFAANSWWWWTLFGDLAADADEAFTKVEKTVWRLVGEVFRQIGRDGGTVRQAATRIAERNHAALRQAYGT